MESGDCSPPEDRDGPGRADDEASAHHPRRVSWYVMDAALRAGIALAEITLVIASHQPDDHDTALAVVVTTRAVLYLMESALDLRHRETQR